MKCDACGDPAEVPYNGRFLCMDCWMELACDRISPSLMRPPKQGGQPWRPKPIEETDPNWDNVVRAMEE